ncbi:MAG: nicotinate-nucleotide--dimethylbenzimidazole phosphoribosyltransferase, partial [Blautia sp.]|nr:nicotinate-nucleotide--dimethylbenzimidazole phosphoribosyltransferase [Blautia sp.]
VHAIEKAIALHQPDPADPIDVLSKVGGFDIGGMIGVYLGAASCHLPVVLDGFITCVAALAAIRLCPAVADYLLVSHVSKEPATRMVLEALGKEAVLHANMCLGEGTGAVTLFPILELAAEVYHSMSTFSEINVEQYEELK